jgi:putative ABC transport system permease protein
VSSFLVALRRLREDRAPAIGLALLVLVTATVFGLAPRMIDRVADDAFRGVVAEAPAFGRNISLVQETTLASTPADPLKNVNEEGADLGKRFPASIQNIVVDRQVVIDSPRWRIEGKTADPSFVRFRLQPGAASRVNYLAGSAPTSATRSVDLPSELLSRLPQVEGPAPTEPVKVNVLQAAISTSAAHEIDRGVGDLIFLSLDPRDPLASRQQGVAAVEITGLFDVTNPQDPFWYEDSSLEKPGIRSLGGDTRLIDVGGLVADDAYDAIVQAGQLHGSPVRYTWRYFVGPERLRAGQLDVLIRDLRRLETTFPQTQATTFALEGTAMRSGLLPIVQTHAARWASAAAVLTVVAIGPAAVAVAALALVATIAARRRRPAIALVRGRGATLGQIVRAIFLEGMVISIPALAAAILIAIVLVPAVGDRPTIIAATVVAVVAVALLIATALPGTTSLLRPNRDDAPRGVSARRLILDVLVIGFAAGGAYLLRERGVRGVSSTGTLSGADPLIAAVPALAGIAAGLTAIRLVPLPLRLLGRIAARGRGFVPLLALRRAVHGGTTAAVLIVLLAAAAIGAFSSAALVHLDRAGQASAWHDVGAPFRVTAQIGSLPADLDPAALPGVRSSAALFRTQIPVGLRNLRIELLAVDAATYDGIVRGSPADPTFPPEMLTGGPGADNVVPLLISPSLADRSDGVKVGQQFEIVIEGYHYQVRPIAVRAAFPTLPTDATYAIASRQQLKVVHPEAQLAPSSLLIDAPDDAGAAITAAVLAVTPGATVDGRAERARGFTDSPVTAAIVAGIAIAAILAGVYAALAVAAALALAGAARAVEVAHLRMLGLSRREALGLAIVEHGPTVLLAFVVGVALGLGLFVLLEPGLGLDALVGSRVEVPLIVDPRQLALVLVGVLVIAAVGIGLAAWMQRRGAPMAALRRGFE